MSEGNRFSGGFAGVDEEEEEDLARYVTLDFRIREKKKKKEEETKIKTNRKLEKTHLLPCVYFLLPFCLVYSRFSFN